MNNETFDHLKLRAAVEGSRLKKAVIAEEAAITEQTLNKFLCGARGPGKQTSRLLAKALGIPENELYKKAS
jgi:transcriptional regulator with XRE-family HTH domain